MVGIEDGCSFVALLYLTQTPPMPCASTNMPVEKVDQALEGAKKGGICNIVALRGGMFHISYRYP